MVMNLHIERCKYIKCDNQQCKNKVWYGVVYCHIHREQKFKSKNKQQIIYCESVKPQLSLNLI